MTKLFDYEWLKQHTEAYLNDPEDAHDWDSSPVGGSGLVPTLLLTTIGRHSKKPRPTPLLYQPTGAGFIVVASRGGSDRHPAWFLNLRDNPECKLRVGKFSYRAKARILGQDERPAYWDWMVRFWPDYKTYQAKTDRQIPVVILESTPT